VATNYNLYNMILALPCAIVALWAMSVICLIWLPLPYLIVIDETDFGFIRVALFGSLIHAAFAACFVALMKANEKGILNVDKLLMWALIELLLVAFLIFWSRAEWSW